MCRSATLRLTTALTLFLSAGVVQAQRVSAPEWRRIGTSTLDLPLAGAATGEVRRVWYSADGRRLFAALPSGQVFETADFETWTRSTAAAMDGPVQDGIDAPEPRARVRAAGPRRDLLYAFGSDVYRSDDGGGWWLNLTRSQGGSIVGEVRDLAVSPEDGEELAVATEFGVFRSLDGGRSWSGLNSELPGLRVRRITGIRSATANGWRIALEDGEYEWTPGTRRGWRPIGSQVLVQEYAQLEALSRAIGVRATAQATSGDFVYAGSADGRLWASSDRGRTWRTFGSAEGGAVERIVISGRDPRLAAAAVAARGQSRSRVLRTFNGGQFWDDWTSNLPEGAVRGLAIDRQTGAIYSATDSGVFMTYSDATGPVPASAWSKLSGLPDAPARDVGLDAEGNQLYVALDGYGIFAALAPHRQRDPRVVSAADYASRAAAPGALLTVLGLRVRAARAGETAIPVLAAADQESQIQVPFGVANGPVALSLDGTTGRLRFPITIESAAPAIFVDRDGVPLIVDAESGTLVDGSTTVRAGSRIQVLAGGLGRVRPEWPAGLPAPLQDPPAVIEEVKALLDRQEVEVLRSVLAPGYVGLYLVELVLPSVANAGPAELMLDVGGKQSNRIRLLIEP